VRVAQPPFGDSDLIIPGASLRKKGEQRSENKLGYAHGHARWAQQTLFVHEAAYALTFSLAKVASLTRPWLSIRWLHYPMDRISARKWVSTFSDYGFWLDLKSCGKATLMNQRGNFILHASWGRRTKVKWWYELRQVPLRKSFVPEDMGRKGTPQGRDMAQGFSLCRPLTELKSVH